MSTQMELIDAINNILASTYISDTARRSIVIYLYEQEVDLLRKREEEAAKIIKESRQHMAAFKAAFNLSPSYKESTEPKI